jgi:hypothetical protein
MGNSIREVPRALELEPVSLSELVHREIRVAIETAVHEELHAALATTPYERSQLRRGYRNGTKTRTLTGPTGPVALTLPHATLFAGAKEWTSRIVPRYHRRMPEVNEAIVATYLAGGNTRRIRGARQPLLRAATLSKSAVTSARSDGDPCRNGGAAQPFTSRASASSARRTIPAPLAGQPHGRVIDAAVQLSGGARSGRRRGR